MRGAIRLATVPVMSWRAGPGRLWSGTGSMATATGTTMPDDLKPPIPATLAGRPVKGGLAYPWVNVELADGGADYQRYRYAQYRQAKG